MDRTCPAGRGAGRGFFGVVSQAVSTVIGPLGGQAGSAAVHPFATAGWHGAFGRSRAGSIRSATSPFGWSEIVPSSRRRLRPNRSARGGEATDLSVAQAVV